jgi:hypothetical protein
MRFLLSINGDVRKRLGLHELGPAQVREDVRRWCHPRQRVRGVASCAWELEVLLGECHDLLLLADR